MVQNRSKSSREYYKDHKDNEIKLAHAWKKAHQEERREFARNYRKKYAAAIAVRVKENNAKHRALALKLLKKPSLATTPELKAALEAARRNAAVAEYRQQMGMTKKDLALTLEVCTTSIYRWEMFYSACPKEVIKKLRIKTS